MEPGTLELFDLSADPGETHDRASEEPDRAQEFRAAALEELDWYGVQALAVPTGRR